jgi:hypothetical protein
MLQLERREIIFVDSFVPSDDDSLLPKMFLTLGKMGKPNQMS